MLLPGRETFPGNSRFWRGIPFFPGWGKLSRKKLRAVGSLPPGEGNVGLFFPRDEMKLPDRSK